MIALVGILFLRFKAMFGDLTLSGLRIGCVEYNRFPDFPFSVVKICGLNTARAVRVISNGGDRLVEVAEIGLGSIVHTHSVYVARDLWPGAESPVEHVVDAPLPPRGFKTENASEEPDVIAMKARKQVERDYESALQQHHKSMEGVRQKLAQARKYAVDAGLDDAIPAGWDTVHYWPSWISRLDQWTPLEVSAT